MGQSLALWALIVAVLGWFLASDPLELSSLSGIDDFHAQYVAPPPSNPLENITRDTESRLQAAQIIGTGEIFGPESIAFDLQGKGPYTGLSDGRIVRYDGPELGWTTFATTSKNRYALFVVALLLPELCRKFVRTLISKCISCVHAYSSHI